MGPLVLCAGAVVQNPGAHRSNLTLWKVLFLCQRNSCFQHMCVSESFVYQHMCSFRASETLTFKHSGSGIRAQGTPNRFKGAQQTPKGSQRDKQCITKLPVNRPSGRYVIICVAYVIEYLFDDSTNYNISIANWTRSYVCVHPLLSPWWRNF